MDKNLYYVFSFNNVLTEMVHSFNYKGMDENYLIIDEWMWQSHQNRKYLEKEHLFKKVLFATPKKIPMADTIEGYEQNIVEYYDNLFRNMGVKIEKFAEIYTVSFEIDFLVYLCKKGIHFNLFSEIQTIGLTDKQRCYNGAFDLVGKYGVTLLDKYQILEYDNPLLKRYFLNLDEYSQKVINEIPKLKHFKLIEELKHLQKKNKDCLINYFNVPRIEAQKEDVLLLTQWYTLKDGAKWDNTDIIKMYGKLLDFFASKENHIYIKPHPADPMKEKYPKILPNIQTDTRNYPVELLTLNLSGKFGKVMTVSSNSINSYHEATLQEIVTGIQFIDIWRNLDLYYIAYFLFRQLKIFFEFITFAREDAYVMNLLVKNMKVSTTTIKFAKEYQLQPNTFYLIRPQEDSEKIFRILSEEIGSAVFLLNIEDSYWFFQPQYFAIYENVIPIKIVKKTLDHRMTIEKQYLFLYLTDKKLRSELKNFTLQKENFFEGYQLEASYCELLEAKTDYLLRSRL
ncbi:hypothetical protein [Hydrogeniiclostridium mannosilyticum]|uniref:hypothetical protein n=1 Tax=Hydrogeniiclostridium mannosilyticum TaxID=2764322 RepID=UPI00399A1897